MKTLTAILFALYLFFSSNPVSGTIGLAEWHLKTPGGNKIAHADPWKEKHGTCLITYGHPDKIYVSNIDWWQYFNDYIIGKTQNSFFLFKESEKTTAFVANETSLHAQARELNIGSPISIKMTPQDGWNMVWDFGLAYQMKNGKEYESLSDDQKELIRNKLRTYKDNTFIDGEIIYLKVINKSEIKNTVEK